MPEGDRPRERLKERGAAALTDAELVAILLRTGMKGTSAVQLAQTLLVEFRTLEELARAPVEAIAKTKGVGETKAIQLKAAFELARRLSGSARSNPKIISSPEEAAAALREDMRLLDREEFRVLLLNTKICRGSRNGISVYHLEMTYINSLNLIICSKIIVCAKMMHHGINSRFSVNITLYRPKAIPMSHQN